MLRETTDPQHPAYLEFNASVDGIAYQLRTRLVITPHFSYDTNFVPQFRLAPAAWQQFQATQPDCLKALTFENGFTLARPEKAEDAAAILLANDPVKAAAAIAFLKERYPGAWIFLQPNFYDPHAMMASVLDDLYAKQELSWYGNREGWEKNKTKPAGFLKRSDGSCHFCVNQHWQLPFECRYGKTRETAPPAGYLEKVVAQFIATGKPAQPLLTRPVPLQPVPPLAPPLLAPI